MALRDFFQEIDFEIPSLCACSHDDDDDHDDDFSECDCYKTNGNANNRQELEQQQECPQRQRHPIQIFQDSARLPSDYLLESQRRKQRTLSEERFSSSSLSLSLSLSSTWETKRLVNRHHSEPRRVPTTRHSFSLTAKSSPSSFLSPRSRRWAPVVQEMRTKDPRFKQSLPSLPIRPVDRWSVSRNLSDSTFILPKRRGSIGTFSCGTKVMMEKRSWQQQETSTKRTTTTATTTKENDFFFSNDSRISIPTRTKEVPINKASTCCTCTAIDTNKHPTTAAATRTTTPTTTDTTTFSISSEASSSSSRRPQPPSSLCNDEGRTVRLCQQTVSNYYAFALMIVGMFWTEVVIKLSIALIHALHNIMVFLPPWLMIQSYNQQFWETLGKSSALPLFSTSSSSNSIATSTSTTSYIIPQQQQYFSTTHSSFHHHHHHYQADVIRRRRMKRPGGQRQQRQLELDQVEATSSAGNNCSTSSMMCLGDSGKNDQQSRNEMLEGTNIIMV